MMRRLVPLGLVLLLPACNYVGNPTDGSGTFLKNTLLPYANANRPQGDMPTMQRVTGRPIDAEPLLPEEGNVWPGPLPPAKTLGDLQREAGAPLGGVEPDPRTPLPRSGSSTPPMAPAPIAPLPRATTPAPQPLTPPRPGAGVLQTPSGPAMTTTNQNGTQTFMLPNGVSGMVINNGNGTATLMGNDGSTLIAPMTR
jgi:hypothetical protein